MNRQVNKNKANKKRKKKITQLLIVAPELVANLDSSITHVLQTPNT